MTMSWQDLGGVGDFVSGLGVLATLAYAVVEFRRSRVLREMEASFEGELAWSEFNLAIAQDEDLARIAVRNFQADATPGDFTPGELDRLVFLGRGYFHRLEAQWFVSQRRGLPPEIWQKRRVFARAYIETPMGRVSWGREKALGQVTSAFIAEIESAPLAFEIGGAG
jgi:hypothetical protein